MVQQPNTSLTRGQKTGFVLLLVFGILAVSLGVLQMRNTIYGPFVVHLVRNEGLENNIDEQVRLQNIDTDQDGLNDYEEISFYQTSAYLPDTDSDGIGDQEEIVAGSDPLCPEGKMCGGVEEGIVTTTSSPFIFPLGQQNEGSLLGLLGQMAGAESNVIPDIQTLLSDPEKLRETLLLSGGISEEALSQFDNETLLQIALELLAEAATSTGE